MKKIINGKVYNTETAKRHGEYEPNPYYSDLDYFCETLYQKKTGEFFLHGEGNAASKYSKNCGQNQWCSSEKIIPMTFKEAQEWAEKHLTPENYCAIFGEPAEDSENVTLGIRVSAAAAAKLKREASIQGITQAALLERMIMES